MAFATMVIVATLTPRAMEPGGALASPILDVRTQTLCVDNRLQPLMPTPHNHTSIPPPLTYTDIFRTTEVCQKQDSVQESVITELKVLVPF